MGGGGRRQNSSHTVVRIRSLKAASTNWHSPESTSRLTHPLVANTCCPGKGLMSLHLTTIGASDIKYIDVNEPKHESTTYRGREVRGVSGVHWNRLKL